MRTGCPETNGLHPVSEVCYHGSLSYVHQTHVQTPPISQAQETIGEGEDSIQLALASWIYLFEKPPFRA